MTTTPLHDQAEERLLDALLDEALADQPATNAWRQRSWLAAALMLFGLAVAVGVAVLARSAPPAAGQDPAPSPTPLPPAIRSEGRAALEDLRRTDPGCRNLWCVLDAEDVALIAGFTELEQLLLEPRLDQGVGRAVGDWDITPLRQCRKLRSLTLGILPSLPAAQLASLRSLPLREFGLIGTTWIVDAALADELGQLALRSLKLQAVRGTPDGFSRLCELPLLEELELWHVLFLHRCDLRLLGRLRQLQRLQLIGLGDRMADAFERQHPLPGDPPSEPGPAAEPGPGLGLRGDQKLVLTAAAMQAIAKLPRLAALDLRSSVLDAPTLAALPPRLRQLGLQDVFVGAPDTFAAIGELRVDELSASICHLAELAPPVGRAQPVADAGDACQAATCALIRRLAPRVLRFEGWITESVGDLLASSTKVEELEFTQVGSKAALHTATFAKMTGLRVLRLRRVPDGTDPAPLRGLAGLREVHLHDARPEVVQSFRAALGDTIAIHAHDS